MKKLALKNQYRRNYIFFLHFQNAASHSVLGISGCDVTRCDDTR